MISPCPPPPQVTDTQGLRNRIQEMFDLAGA